MAPMRLLNTVDMKLKLFHDIPDAEGDEFKKGYGIVSHVWFRGDSRELTYADVTSIPPSARRECSSFPDGAGKVAETWKALAVDENDRDDDEPTRGKEITPSHRKLMAACELARADKLKWVWIDTCCINKSDLEETQRSINAMFEWYAKAEHCYVYLADVTVDSHKDLKATAPKPEWFMRGWTLQEMLAHPWSKERNFTFYNKDWKPIGTKKDWLPHISRFTRVSEHHIKDHRTACAAVKLSWASDRTTRYPEDRVYCMLGLLGVNNMDVGYGGRYEQNAFKSLQARIINDQRDESIFAWTFPSVPRYSSIRAYGMMAPSMECFRACGKLTVNNQSKYRPRRHDCYKTERDILTFQVPSRTSTPILSGLARDFRSDPLNKAIMHQAHVTQDLALNCWDEGRMGNNTVRIKLKKSSRSGPWQRTNCHALDWTDRVGRSSTILGGNDATQEFVIAN